MCGFTKDRCMWVSVSLRRKYQFCQWVNTPLAALHHRVICCNSDDQGWCNNTSPLLLVPSASPHILSFFPHCDCFLYFISPWHHRSIDILVLLCHANASPAALCDTRSHGMTKLHWSCCGICIRRTTLAQHQRCRGPVVGGKFISLRLGMLSAKGGAAPVWMCPVMKWVR